MLDVYSLRKLGYKPYRLAISNGRVVELINYPFKTENGNYWIMARLIPNDPTTMVALRIPDEAIDYI